MLYRALLLSVAANCVLVLCVIFFASSNHALVLCTQFGVCVVLVLVATNVPSLYEVRKINPVVARESEIHHQLGGVLTGSFRFFFFFFFFFLWQTSLHFRLFVSILVANTIGLVAHLWKRLFHRAESTVSEQLQQLPEQQPPKPKPPQQAPEQAQASAGQQPSAALASGVTQQEGSRLKSE